MSKKKEYYVNLTNLFALCFCQQAVFLGPFVLALLANQAAKDLLEGWININGLTFPTFGV